MPQYLPSLHLVPFVVLYKSRDALKIGLDINLTYKWVIKSYSVVQSFEKVIEVVTPQGRWSK